VRDFAFFQKEKKLGIRSVFYPDRVGSQEPGHILAKKKWQKKKK
jgi:hypothetical protein